MAGMTSYLQKALLDDLLGIASYSTPATVYLSLHTASPTDTGSHANEVGSGKNYVRQSLASKMGAANSSSGISVNTATITFGVASADWGTITDVAMEDVSTLAGGNMLMWGAPTIATTVNSGASYVLSASQLAMRFD
jgi:hypothetical protein